MTARSRQRPTTAQRGYDHRHRKERDRRLALWRPGDPCARCGQPMWHKTVTTPACRSVSVLDVDDYTGRAVGGPQVKRLAHRHCMAALRNSRPEIDATAESLAAE